MVEPKMRGIFSDISTLEINKHKEKATKNDNPPARAVGIECTFLLLGTSIAPIIFESFSEGENIKYEIKNPIKPINK